MDWHRVWQNNREVAAARGVETRDAPHTVATPLAMPVTA
jgi:hypothetical protein